MPADLVPYESEDDARAKRYSELMDVHRDRHGRIINAQTQFIRARGQQITEEIAGERFSIQRQNLELARMKALTDLMKQKAAIEQQQITQQHTAQALDQLGKIDPTSPDYHLRLAEVFHANPMAAKDPIIQDIVRSQIQSKHVMETTASEIRQHEEAQGSEFSRLHGVNVEYDPKTGRIDWEASQKKADAALTERQKAAVEGVDPSLKPLETTVEGGKVKQSFKAPVEKMDTVTTTTKPPIADINAEQVTTTRTTHVPAGSVPIAPPAPQPTRIKMKLENGALVPAE